MKRLFLASTGLGWSLSTTWAAEGGVDVLPDNFGLQIWVLLTFLVMFGLLAKLTFKPIGEALDRRSRTIKKALDDAEQSQAESKRLMDQYQQQLAAARQEAQKLLEESRTLGENVRQEVVAKAAAEAGALVQRAQEEIQREKDKSLQELRQTVADLSVQIAGKVIEQQLDAAAHEQLVQSLVKDLGKIRRA
ncbi:F0F1 ATP synthase subunit B [bacterium]|nr:F0F1 ATP synthase subunit B [bacterium]